MLTFGIKDIIDILLVALLLYYIYKLMKETRSAKVFSGIIIFILVWLVVTHVVGMRLLGGIMDQLMSIGALAMVIIFQEEIRSFFSTIGTHRSVNLFVKMFRQRHANIAPTNEHIMPIVMACMNMSRQKTGALIVIEREVSLSEEIKTGDILNANINQRLIENIFFKNSPLHDGALIVSKNKIRAAGCILPVSHSADIPKALGLRHRSALGISEKSDSITIIVSEETGGISVAEGGTFRLRMTSEALESFLREKWVVND